MPKTPSEVTHDPTPRLNEIDWIVNIKTMSDDDWMCANPDGRELYSWAKSSDTGFEGTAAVMRNLVGAILHHCAPGGIQGGFLGLMKRVQGLRGLQRIHAPGEAQLREWKTYYADAFPAAPLTVSLLMQHLDDTLAEQRRQ